MTARLLFTLALLFFAAACDSIEEEQITFRDLAVGTGAEVASFQTVTISYVGRVGPSGCTFESDTVPVTLGAREVPYGAIIRGLDGVRIGGKREVTVPPTFGLGDRSTTVGDCTIPAGSTLIYDVEVLDFFEFSIDQDIEGTGEVATAQSCATVRYAGRLQTGQTFDTNQGAGREPLLVRVGPGCTTEGYINVVPGFARGILGMKVGGGRTVTFAPSLGYGGSRTGSIAPYSVLTFDILLESLSEGADMPLAQ